MRCSILFFTLFVTSFCYSQTLTAEHYIEQARIQTKSSHYESAYVFLNSAQELEPDNKELNYLMMATTYYSLSYRKSAITEEINAALQQMQLSKVDQEHTDNVRYFRFGLKYRSIDDQTLRKDITKRQIKEIQTALINQIPDLNAAFPDNNKLNFMIKRLKENDYSEMW